MRLDIAPGIFFWKTCHNFLYRNIDISCTHAKGHATLREIFLKMCDKLMRLGESFDQILY